ncbi:longitudinals lacking protein, isoforms J/P/Q/S/Z isoform X2 [Drosophila rhopaloa]|uniref:Longitudinals lacking protein, isoforms J/P/Q/S/Z isoform X2 n=1 Tax=Drosophila rhopaloa TaxID=1041015 RepID=A0A6P4FDE6_DRORH|nr:longitudinals lacking protein, isoforms J/P/Q/S/Z isoform X2 [Drosophila rhopaloa]
MDDDQQFCLRWNNHQSTLISVFDTLLENETLVDCTLAAEGKFLKAHKVVLSACSPYFATLLQEQYDKHPIFILKDVKYQELRAMMDYMYRGEVNISQDQLAALLKAAESLQIKGLSDNRTGGGAAPKPESSGHHRGGKLSGAYTLEQTKRARLATSGAMDTSGDVSGSREGSSSPSRRRRKVRRRSMENDAHDNSNSSVLQAASNQSILQTGAGMAVSALVSTQLSSGPPAGTSSHVTSTQQQQPLTSTNVTKKTESAKLTSSTAAPASGAAASAAAVQQAQLQQTQTTSDAINTENVQAQSQGGAQGVQGDEEDMDEGSAVGGASAASGPNPTSASASAVHAGVVVKQLASVVDKSSSNHKQKIKDNSVSSVGSEMVIEPKAEYDDDAHDENVEDLTLDEEDMTMEELDQTAGTSQGGEGSSQTYATWQHDRSQDELGLMAQDAQQRDPQDESGQLEGGESRIRVRNWLMLADQSIIEKSSDEPSDKLTQSKKSLINEAKTTNKSSAPIRPRVSTTTTSTSTAAAAAATIAAKQAAAAIASSNINNNNSSLTQTLTQTVTRIGSIGRTTIACITPANNGNKSSSNNCNVDAASAAALAAAGVELDSIDDTMTEVIVKIENPENMPLNGDDDDEAVCNEAIEDENTFDYDLKLGSPLSWTYDAVKIENEEFEDSYLMDNDDDDDDLLTTAAATQKHAKQSNDKQIAGSLSTGAGGAGAVKKIVLSAQQQQQLLEQQQHLQHLQLQPTSQSLQIKLPAIPATITTISAPKQMVAGAGTSGSLTTANCTLMSNKLGLPMKGQNLDLHWSHSDDNRYRVLVQNKRTRKESLEHSADMIYNADIEKPWVCRNCNRTYKWKNSLKCHLKNECGLPPRYFCSKMCGYATNVHSNLKRHLNTKCRDREKDAEEEKKPLPGGNMPVVLGVGNGTVVPVSNSNNNNGGSSTSSTYTLVFQNDSA